MHIAVCDDNVADRKQTERLLGRESDARIQTSGNLYIDSYGNVDSLMQAPMKYDLFFLDMTESKPDGMETAVMLRKSGVTAPIVLCISKIDYRLISPAPENILYLEKPIKKAELSELLDRAQVMFEAKPRTVELRDEKCAHYVLPDQIIYAVPDKNCIRIKLSDDTEIKELCTIEDLGQVLSEFDHFVFISDKIILNINHITCIKKRIVTMSDNAEFKAGLSEWKSLLRLVSDRGSRFVPENLTN